MQAVFNAIAWAIWRVWPIASRAKEGLASAVSGYCSPEGLASLYGYPHALAKSCCDPFCYVMELSSGTRIFFEKAEPLGRKWVYLPFHGIAAIAPKVDDGGAECSAGFKANWILSGVATFERGIYVRVDQITMVADAPYGS